MRGFAGGLSIKQTISLGLLKRFRDHFPVGIRINAICNEFDFLGFTKADTKNAANHLDLLDVIQALFGGHMAHFNWCSSFATKVVEGRILRRYRWVRVCHHYVDRSPVHRFD